jgi:predicted dehydrogenase/threonine dehydrogenase-like Zn-dependent dehydrogenase
MKQVVQNYKTGQVTLETVPAPLCLRKGILVRNCHSLISTGTERSVIELGKKSLIGKAKARPDLLKRAIDKAKKEGFLKTFKEAMGRLDLPTPLGYSSAGIVIEAGDQAHLFNPSDRVACIGQGFASHAEFLSIPVNLACKIPDNVSEAEAAFGMLGCIALHGVRCADLHLGSTVVVIGLGLLGLLAAQMLVAYGCQVIAYDIDENKVKIAKKFGLMYVTNVLDDLKRYVAIHTGLSGADSIIVTTATQSKEPIDVAVELSRIRGRIVLVGVATINPNRNDMWHKEVEIIVSKAAGAGSLYEWYEKDGFDLPIEYGRWTQNRNLKEFLRLISEEKINLKPLMSQHHNIDEAEEVYKHLLKSNDSNVIGVLFDYPKRANKKTDVCLNVYQTTSKARRVVLGVIGAGLFGKAILLPELNKLKGVSKRILATCNGDQAHHSGKKFKFHQCTTDESKIFSDSQVNAVIALTPHSHHANVVLDAIKYNKALFVEKPICINIDEWQKIKTAYEKSTYKPIIMVGHNRRYSPHAKKIRRWLNDRINPLMINMRINVGYLIYDHWVHHDNQGRSRIIGEMTHFIDLMQYYTQENIVSVFASRVVADNKSCVNNDNIIVNIQFNAGSVGCLFYTASGNKNYFREQTEIAFDDCTICSTNFRKSYRYKNGKVEKYHTSAQQLGYAQELKTFVSSVEGYASGVPGMSEILHTMKVVFAIEESLARKQMINIDNTMAFD